MNKVRSINQVPSFASKEDEQKIVIFDRFKHITIFENAYLVGINNPKEVSNEYFSEFIELAISAGVEIVHTQNYRLKKINPKYYISTGMVNQIQDELHEIKIDVIIFNTRLSPSQERNLQNIFRIKVIDRIRLILDIFAQRARSHEGKLQVELAQLMHMSTRLVRGWTHLERQKGGIGLRGPGETQLETDRRIINKRIVAINNKLNKISQQRQLSRRKRHKFREKIIAIVGYTNAGKSTLFNKFTKSKILVEDKLFATLDATLRTSHIGGSGKYIFVDTVGFIRHLPHELIESFKSTLEETLDANLLIHLIDYADSERLEKEQDVTELISKIGATNIPCLKVYNKIDLYNKNQADNEQNYIAPHSVYKNHKLDSVYISVTTQQGLQLLCESIAELIENKYIKLKLTLKNTSDGKLRAQLFTLGQIHAENHDKQGRVVITISLTEVSWQKLDKSDIENYSYQTYPKIKHV